MNKEISVRAEVYHVLIGLCGVVGWFWGTHAGLQPDAIEYCKMCAVGVIGSAIGMQARRPAQPDQPKISAPAVVTSGTVYSNPQ